MASERADTSKAAETDKTANDGSPAGAPAATSSGGVKVWIPLLLNLLLMPVIAYFTTTLVLLPKLGGTHESHSSSDGKSGHGESSGGHGKGKFTIPLSGKVLVNVSGTAGTRYLMVNLALVGSQATLREQVEKNEAELRDVAAGVLAAKTIADLEKPGARNLIRTELLSVFNSVLGEGAVSELFLTEFAIQ